MTYRNSRLKHVKKIEALVTEIRTGNACTFIDDKSAEILDQCNLLLEKKKKKSHIHLWKDEVCQKCGKGWYEVHPKKYSLPNEKEILGMLDGLTIIVRK